MLRFLPFRFFETIPPSRQSLIHGNAVNASSADDSVIHVNAANAGKAWRDLSYVLPLIKRVEGRFVWTHYSGWRRRGEQWQQHLDQYILKTSDP